MILFQIFSSIGIFRSLSTIGSVNFSSDKISFWISRKIAVYWRWVDISNFTAYHAGSSHRACTPWTNLIIYSTTKINKTKKQRFFQRFVSHQRRIFKMFRFLTDFKTLKKYKTHVTINITN
jgi:hypothetical protein